MSNGYLIHLKRRVQHIVATTVFKNMASLGLLQIANYLIPILIIPIVVRALGIEAFGKASYAQNIIAYLTVLINYGFEYSATQDIAINKANPTALKRVFWTVFRTKLVLLLLSFIILVLLYFTFEPVGADFKLYVFAALINIGFWLFPTWFFQGIEEMGKMAIFNFCIKLLGAGCIVTLVHSPTDYRLYLLLLSLSYIMVGFISYLYVIKKYRLSDAIVSEIFDKSVVRKAFPIFLNNVFVSFYTLAGTTIIGLYLTNIEVGLYSGVHRVIMAILMLTSMPFNLALFPTISKKFDSSRQEGWCCLKKVLCAAVTIGAIVGIAVFLFAPLMVSVLLGTEFTDGVYLLRLASPLPLLVIVASVLTVQGLYGLQLQRIAPYIGLFLGVLYIGVNLLVVPNYGVVGALIAWIMAQLCEIMIVSVVIKIKR